MTGQEYNPAGMFAGRSSVFRFWLPALVLTGVGVGVVAVTAGLVPAIVAGVAIVLSTLLSGVDGQIREWWHLHDGLDSLRAELRTVQRAAAEAEGHLDELRRRLAEQAGVDPEFDRTQVAE